MKPILKAINVISTIVMGILLALYFYLRFAVYPELTEAQFFIRYLKYWMYFGFYLIILTVINQIVWDKDELVKEIKDRKGGGRI